MDYLIDFPALPSVVQDLIVHEIVHHSIPEDRICFAQTAKFCNELVQRAKPKKIVKNVIISGVFNQVSCHIGHCSIGTMGKLDRISRKFQIEGLEFWTSFLIYMDEKMFFPMLDHLSNATEFTTKLVLDNRIVRTEKFAEFFKKFKHLKRLDMASHVWLLDHLSYIPPHLCFADFKEDETYDWLKILAKKSTEQPLTSLYIDGIVPINLMREFLREANFFKYGVICFKCNAMNGVECWITMVVLDSNLYEVEVFPYSKPYVIVNQKIGKDNKRDLCALRTRIWHDLKTDAPPIPFTVVTSSSPTTPIFSSELTTAGELHFTLDNLGKNEWVKLNVEGDLRVRYVVQMLADWFPRNEYKTSEERIEKINEVLGTKISIIKLEMLDEMIANEAVMEEVESDIARFFKDEEETDSEEAEEETDSEKDEEETDSEKDEEETISEEDEEEKLPGEIEEGSPSGIVEEGIVTEIVAEEGKKNVGFPKMNTWLALSILVLFFGIIAWQVHYKYR